MTQLVVLESAPPASDYDEVAVFSKALSASDIADIIAARDINYLSDPQEALGWEEVYGPEHPLTAGSVPVMANGLCRVRYSSVYNAHVVDAFIPGLGYVEQGRVTVWMDDTGTLIQQGTLRSVIVREWTPERAVLRLTTTAVASGVTYRMETYVTLQRGWTAPRFECYPSPRADGAALGAHVRWSPVDSSAIYGVALGTPTRPLAHSELGATWPASYTQFDSSGEPWAAVFGGDRTTVLVPTRATARSRTYDDTAAYGTVRKAVAICADYGTAAAGYVSALLGFSSAGWQLEAEAYKGGGGNPTIQTEGGTSGGRVIDERSTIETAKSLDFASVVFPAGRYAGWARVKVTTGGATGSFRLLSTSTTRLAVVTTTSTTYVWVYLGEITVATGNLVWLNGWRSAGSGTVRIDKVVILPTESRVARWDGIRDLALASLYDARSLPDLVSR